MADKKHAYTIYGESQQPSEAAAQQELEDVKAKIEQALSRTSLSFPVRSKEELLKAVPGDLDVGCKHIDRRIPLGDLISGLREDDFPMDNAGDAATLIAAHCPISAESFR
jgi:hypothetical protein